LNEIVDIYNIVSVPIVNAKGTMLGCLEIANKQDRLPFDTQDIFMLQGLAASGAVALENARLLEQEKFTAVTLRNERDQAKAYFNVAGVIMLIINKGELGEVYNVGSNKEMQIVDLAQVVLAETGSKSQITYHELPADDPMRRGADNSKITSLGWTQKVDINDGVRKMINSTHNNILDLK